MKTIIFPLILLFSMEIFAQQIQQQQVSLFKNGKGFFINKIQTNAENGISILETLPKPLYGTFWAGGIGNKIRSLKTYTKIVESKHSNTNIGDFLRANIGKNVKVSLHNQGEAAGKIEALNGNWLTLRGENTFKVLDIQQIKEMTFSENPQQEYTEKNKKRVLEIVWDKNSKQQELNLMYLQNEIGWLPTYQLELLNDQKARLTLQAEVQNDAEDLQNATLNFVVGVPNFMFASHDAMLFGDQNLQSFLNQLSGNQAITPSRSRNDLQRQAMSNIVSQSYMDYGSSDSDESSETQTEGTTQEDLFFYTQNGISLPKGGRAIFTLFEAEVNFRHAYEVSLRNNQTNRYTAGNEEVNSVWHSVELENKSASPWTTGAILILKRENEVSKPLSQDMLKYTPVGTKSWAKITVAPDIMVKDGEKELTRQAKSKKHNDYYYDLVTIEGTIEICNRKDKAIDLTINRQVTGMMLSGNAAWEVTKNTNFLDALNFSNSVVWKLNLKPKEERTIKYQYQMYFRQ